MKPTSEQVQFFARFSGACRYVSNLGLEQRSLNWKQFRTSLSYSDQCKELTQLKKEKDVEWLNDVPSQCLQQALKDLNTAFQNFFSKRSGYPNFKCKYEDDSFRFPQPSQFTISSHKKKGWIDLPKIGVVQFICTRKNAYEGAVKSVTIKRDVDTWYLSIHCEVEVQDYEVVPEEDIGLDLGVVHTITASNGQHWDLPIEKLKWIEQKIAQLQRKLSKLKKGGSHWREVRTQIAKLYRKIRRIKEDFIQKATTQIVKNYGSIAVEDLKLKNMTASAKGTIEEPGTRVAQKSGLNRAILRASLGRIIQLIKYKSEWMQRGFKSVPPQNSSLECSQCRRIHSDNRKSQAEFECIYCHYQDNADRNAAIVIQKRAFGPASREPREVPVGKMA